MAAKITPAPLTRSLSVIARDIKVDYTVRQGKPVYFAAAPYVDAMLTMHTTDLSARFGYDGAEDMVIRLLGNLSSWRGPEATRVKAELKAAVNFHNVSQGKKVIY